MTTPLARKIKSIIAEAGPITVADYFAICLADPEHGYYRSREPFGRSGDFTTAPEISQLFGELIGIFVVHAWQGHGHGVRLLQAARQTLSGAPLHARLPLACHAATKSLTAAGFEQRHADALEIASFEAPAQWD